MVLKEGGSPCDSNWRLVERKNRVYPSSYYITMSYLLYRLLWFYTHDYAPDISEHKPGHTGFNRGCNDTKRERPRLPPAESGGEDKARHVQETARREVDLSSSYLEDNSKSGPNRSLWLLSCNLRIILHVLFMSMKKCT